MSVVAAVETKALWEEELKHRFSALTEADPLFSLRKKAWTRFLEMGSLPHTRQEPFRHFPLRKLFERSFIGSSSTETQISFKGGAGAQILTLGEAMLTYGSVIEHRMHEVLKHEKDPFALLNLALFEASYFVYVPPGQVIEALEITLRSTPGVVAFPRIHFFVGRGAECRLTVDVDGDAEQSLLISQLDFLLEEGASVHVVQQTQAESQMQSIRCYQKRDSRFHSLYTTAGCAHLRDDYHVVLAGENCFAELLGLCRLAGRKQSHTHVLVEHRAPNCCSRQHFKGVLEDHARSSFEGKIYVHKEAQQTDAYQMNNNLLIGKRTHADSKPNLEIFADDVKASHGSTTGQLDEEHLFYLKTRGIEREEAKKLLIEAFCAEVLSSQ